MNFRLTYDGPLKAQSQSETRRIEKHEIRRILSRQLKALLNIKNDLFKEELRRSEQVLTFPRGNFQCFAIVREALSLVCDLDILFLRRDNPGQLISHGGDLDNRIKVLFDALRIPQNDDEVRGLNPDDDDGVLLLCLTEDDRLITGFRVTSDRLLEPATSEMEQNHVRLIINVEVKATKLTQENLAYFSHF